MQFEAEETTKATGDWKTTNKAWDPRASSEFFGGTMGMHTYSFSEVSYEGGFISGFTTLDVSGGCVW